MSDFSKIVKNFRLKTGLNQEEFARLVGVARTSIVSYEQGKVEPKASLIWLIAKNDVEKCKHCNGKGFIFKEQYHD